MKDLAIFVIPLILGFTFGGWYAFKSKVSRLRDVLIVIIAITLLPSFLVGLSWVSLPSVTITWEDYLAFIGGYLMVGIFPVAYLVKHFMVKRAFIYEELSIPSDNSNLGVKYIYDKPAKVTVFADAILLNVGGVFIIIGFAINDCIGFTISLITLTTFLAHISYLWKFVRCPHCKGFVLLNIHNPLEVPEYENKVSSLAQIIFLAAEKQTTCACCRGKVKFGTDQNIQ